MASDRAHPFDESALLDEACRKAGLDDYGDEGFRRPLGVLLASYADAGLNAIGTTVLRTSIRRSLTQRLRVEAWLARHPEIAEERIEAPIVVVGMMRSGTTLVQRLLSRDPRLHCAYGWEIAEPAPPLDIDWSAPDPRIAAGVARAEQMREFAPQLHAIHPTDALEADEEIVFLADAFLSHIPEASCNVPRYRSWIDTQDFTPAYRHLRRVLQLLQWQKRKRGESGERWVLKTPAHLGYLETLFATFPDATVVQMHRDPVETVSSGASLNATLWRMYADDVDPAVVGRQWLERMGWSTQRCLRVRDQLASQPERFVDVDYREAVAGPIAAAQRIYDALDLELVPGARSEMEQWLSQDAREKHPAHRYEPEQFGLSATGIREVFASYTDRFLDSRAKA